MKLRLGPQHRGWIPLAEQTIDDYPLRVYRWPDSTQHAPSLAAIHGMEEDWDVWQPACRRLADRFQIFCLDLPWHGRDGYAWGLKRSPAEWLHHGLQLVPDVPSIILAHSFGANAALEYLARHAAPQLQALILASPFYRARIEDFDWDFFDATRRGFRETMLRGLRARLAPDRDMSLLAAMTDKVIDQIGPLGFLEFFALFSRTPHLDVARIRVPALIISGEDDLPVMAHGNADLAEALPLGRFEQLHGCGHFSLIEQPATFADAIECFISESIVVEQIAQAP